MSRRGYSTEQIIHKLREAEVLLSKGQKVPQVCREKGGGHFSPEPKKIEIGCGFYDFWIKIKDVG